MESKSNNPVTVELNEAATSASDWVLNSRIQSLDQQPDCHGAFYAWVDEDAAEENFIYPEITGYGITALLYIDSLQNKKKLMQRACLAGDWVLNYGLHRDFGGVPPRNQFSPHKILVTFDTGMVLCGLSHLFQRSKKPAYLKGARRMADFLIDHGQKGNGLFDACFDLVTQQWVDTPEKWSTQSGSYHAKLSLGFLQLYHLTGSEKYRTATERICDASLKLQLPTGRFVTYRNDEGAGPNAGATHMHPHLYSAEGLLVAGMILDRPEYIDSAARAVQWSLEQQLSDGGVPCFVNSAGDCNVNQRSDTLAQVLRMGALCHGVGGLPVSCLSSLARLKLKLLSYQNRIPNQPGKENGMGGFYYGKEINGIRRNHVNFWCTVFALQGLVAYRNMVLDGVLPDLEYPDIRYLI